MKKLPQIHPETSRMVFDLTNFCYNPNNNYSVYDLELYNFRPMNLYSKINISQCWELLDTTTDHNKIIILLATILDSNIDINEYTDQFLKYENQLVEYRRINNLLSLVNVLKYYNSKGDHLYVGRSDKESIVFKFANISLEELKDWNGLNFLNSEELDVIIQIANKFENFDIIPFIQNLKEKKILKPNIQ